MDIKTGNAKDKLDAALNGLVESVYSKLNMVNKFVESDGRHPCYTEWHRRRNNRLFAGLGANNEDALNEISQWLELQNAKMLSNIYGRMLQRRYGAIPYGWREIDIAALVAPSHFSAETSPSNTVELLLERTSADSVDYLRKKV